MTASSSWEPVHSSAFVELIGPLHRLVGAPAPTFGIRVRPEHTNTYGGAHGGFVASLVDVAAGRGIRALLADGRAFVTVSMTIDYTATVAVGQWLSFQVQLDDVTGRTAFLTCRVSAGADPRTPPEPRDAHLVARATVILRSVGPPPDAAGPAQDERPDPSPS